MAYAWQCELIWCSQPASATLLCAEARGPGYARLSEQVPARKRRLEHLRRSTELLFRCKPDKKKLLANCGSSTFKLICSLVEANKIATISCSDLVKLVKDYYEPKPCEIVQHYKFNTRVHKPKNPLLLPCVSSPNTATMGTNCKKCSETA